ncbi:inorganic phosphate transporter [Neisseria iguanae]|nr:inorganic phosphate transporter [Neisseria iguanae]
MPLINLVRPVIPLVWGIGCTNGNHTMLFLPAILSGVFMALNIGGNGIAKSSGTPFGAGTLTITQTLLVAAVFKFSSAMISGGEVISTIHKGITDLKAMDLGLMQFVYIMISALLASALMLLFTPRKLAGSGTRILVGAVDTAMPTGR